MSEDFSQKVIERFALYHCIFEDCLDKGIQVISSRKIAELLHIDDSQVRKDLKLLKNFGKCKVGYRIDQLKASIEKSLGFKRAKVAFIVGAGNLGFALAKYNNFVSYGLNVLALFDNDPLKVGSIVNGKEIFHIDKLTSLSKKLNVELVILTVPRQIAQSVANLLVTANIKFIWNFSPTVLDVPNDVQVLNENLMGNFLKFTEHYKKENKMKNNIKICMGSSCFARGNNKNLEFIEKYIQDNNLNATVELEGFCCEGKCQSGPNLKVDDKLYTQVNEEKIKIILEGLKNG